VADETPEFVRLSLADPSNGEHRQLLERMRREAEAYDESREHDSGNYSAEDEDSDVDEEIWLPELRLVRKTDPEAYQFNAPQYSAHKLPKDVVDASQSGEGLREFARDWENILAKRRNEDAELAESSDDD
jgi:hypothetical protein